MFYACLASAVVTATPRFSGTEALWVAGDPCLRSDTVRNVLGILQVIYIYIHIHTYIHTYTHTYIYIDAHAPPPPCVGSWEVGNLRCENIDRDPIVTKNS